MLQRMFNSAQAKALNLLPVAVARRRIARAHPIPPHHLHETRQLLVDVSVIAIHDARTGIQRVVRAILTELMDSPPTGYEVRPIYATRKHGYCYAPVNFMQHPDSSENGPGMPVKVGLGDIFLGLDLAAHLLPRYHYQLSKWKRQGAMIHIVVYDLLPLQHPEWFNGKTVHNFQGWIKTVAMYADSAICISHSVKSELRQWLATHFDLKSNALPISTIPLGADIEASLPSHGLPENTEQLLAGIQTNPTVLMVGTLEPRKGHAQALAAFELLWKSGQNVNLVIVGKPGWKTEHLQRSLRTHVEKNKRLFWFEDASDEFLEKIYAISTGLLVASEAEGFGLPLIEAMRLDKPVLARDLAVFREVGGDCLSYFTNGDPNSLMQNITTWLDQISQSPRPNQCASLPTWRITRQQMLMGMGLR